MNFNLTIMKTAEEFFREKIRENYLVPLEFSLANMDFLNAEKAMRWAQEYSILKVKYYVTEALKQASGKIDAEDCFRYSSERNVVEKVEQDILNAYPLENIK